MTNDEAIELAKHAIAPCKGVTLAALKRVIELAEKHEKLDAWRQRFVNWASQDIYELNGAMSDQHRKLCKAIIEKIGGVSK